MSSKSTISISFRVTDGANGLKTLTADAEALQKAVRASVTESENLTNKLANLSGIAVGIDQLQGVLSNFQSALKGLTDAYSIQVEAETRLATNMRNTMSATESEIQSIKDLCAAQQKLGVIGDEIQLAGAQELATYLTKKKSLEQLIPVMNDMIAQQYGYSATAESAANIATMLGKVMDGQVGALSRYGYKFDEAQAQILKFGDEQERVAVLAEVIESSVGGSNKALANTPFGPIKQLSNNLGDVKEQLGELVVRFQPIIDMLASTTVAAGGVIKLAGGFSVLKGVVKSACLNLKTFWATTAVVTSSSSGLTKAIGTTRLFISQFCTALTQGTKGLRLFATAWKGMLISTGVGAAIAAVTSIIAYFALATDDATSATSKFLSEQERAKRDAEQLEQIRQQEAETLKNSRSELELNISKLGEFNGTKEQERSLVEQMNNTYGETMGYFSSVSDWYNALVSNSEAYCKQMVVEARTRMLANQIAEKEQENYDISQNIAAGKYSKKRDKEFWSKKDIAGTSELDKANAAIEANNEAVSNLREQLRSATEEAANIKMTVIGSQTRTNPQDVNNPKVKPIIPKGSLADINQQISNIKAQIDVAVSPESGAALQAELELLEQRKRQIEFSYKFPDFTPNEIPALNLLMTTVTLPKPDISEMTASVNAMKQHFDEFQQSGIKAGGNIGDAFGALGGSLSSIGGLLDETAQKWMSYVGQVLESIPQLIQAITALAASKAAASAAETPVVGWLMVGAAIASTLGAMAAIPKFADGGIVSGPTVGLIGEYAGASNNPEVVAPLDKLRSLITPAAGIDAGKVEFVIDGRVLRGVLRRVDNLSNRT